MELHVYLYFHITIYAISYFDRYDDLKSYKIIQVHFIVKIIQYSYLGSISSTFYVQLLRLQIPKAQKDTDDLTVFFHAFGIFARKSCT